VGICAPGTTRTGTLIAIYTAYMAAAQIMYEHGSAADPWLTTVGYFNALRELGSMRRAVEDSVRSRLERRDDAGRRYVNFENIEELTSRKSAEDIPKILDRLENRFERDENGRYPAGKFPLDVVLATNMISVGVDVDRLGLMIAAGQPKATAEYIQATSRVGRKFPGVVAPSTPGRARATSAITNALSITTPPSTARWRRSPSPPSPPERWIAA
jgi:superfamily II DNA or RNA helicase